MRIPKVELGILKAITNDYNTGVDFSRSYSHEIFSEDAQKFVGLITDYYKAYKAVPTKRVLLDKYSSNKNIAPYVNEVWNQLDSISYDDREYKYDLDKVKKSYSDKLVLALEKKIARSESNGELTDTSSVVKDIELTIQKIKGLAGTQAYTQKSLKEDIVAFRKEYAAKKADPSLGKGISTGYSAIDYATDGFREAELVIIGGETGSGKSMMLNNIAIQMWMQKNTITTQPTEFTEGHNVLYFSLEMPFDRCRARTYARMADVPLKKLLKGELTQEQEERLDMVLEFVENYPFEFQIIDFPRGATTKQIELRYLDAKSKFDPRVVAVDYMGLMSSEDLGQDVPDWLMQSHIAGELHEFTRVNNVVGLTAVQLTTVDPNKKKDKEEYNPENNVGTHRIGRSRLIMHHANVGIQIIKRKNETHHSNLMYQFFKNRDGENDIKGSMNKNFSHASLLDIPYSNNNIIEDESGDISNKMPVNNLNTPAALIPQAILDMQEDEDGDDDN